MREPVFFKGTNDAEISVQLAEMSITNHLGTSNVEDELCICVYDTTRSPASPTVIFISKAEALMLREEIDRLISAIGKNNITENQ